jgi:hypothetical protein
VTGEGFFARVAGGLPAPKITPILRPRIVVISPLAERTVGTVVYSLKDNAAMARDLCRHLCAAGFAAFAPHGFYSMFLDDRAADQRVAGMESGAAWLAASQGAFVDVSIGLSSGMCHDLALCTRLGIPAVFYDRDRDRFETVADSLRHVVKP